MPNSHLTLSGHLVGAYAEHGLSSLGTHVIRSLKRGENGRFTDSELAELIKTACVVILCVRQFDSQHARIEHPAATFGARGTPQIMRLHEIMGIEANRRWGVCTLNEFRKVSHSIFHP
jgi:hypothetical protein